MMHEPDAPDPLTTLDRALAKTPELPDRLEARGRLTEATGIVLRARVPGIRVGELAEIQRDGQRILEAEVVGFRGDEAVLMPLGPLTETGPDCEVVPTGHPLSLRCSEGLLGRVLDGLGRPLDGKPLPADGEDWPVHRSAPDPLTRRRITAPLGLGIRALDGLCTVGEGQRVGLFAGAGVGKSTLLGQIARQATADVCVVCLVGERGREVREFLEESLGPEGLARSVAVVATSDTPSLVRLKSAFVATALAEWFRARGKRVLLLMDSLTRFARAQREVGLAAGEPPARQGYPPSVFAMLPRLLERTGNAATGSITALYTVLVAGGDLEEPISDEVRGILDGHIVLSRELAEDNHYPAIDVLASLSRVMSRVADADHRHHASILRKLLAHHADKRDLIALGAYSSGSDLWVDRYMERRREVQAYLQQRPDEATPLPEAAEGLARLVKGFD